MGKKRSTDTNNRTAKIGRLEVLNGHGALMGQLWETDGTVWRCHFKKEHLGLLPDAWMHTVKLIGRAIVEEGKEPTLEVDSIQITDENNRNNYDQIKTTPFWSSIPLAELAQQQGVSPVEDVDQVSALWPADDDPDELLDYILAEQACHGQRH